jgi:glycosyltransferase involved in cell wall biosynthesis
MNSKQNGIVCALTTVLGNHIISKRIEAAVLKASDPQRVKTIWFDHSIYRQYPAPRIIQRISALESEWVARRWLAHQDLTNRTLVVNGYNLALAARHPTMVVALDRTPAMIAQAYSGPQAVLAKVTSLRFARLAKRVRAWLPISEGVKRSLVKDYGVSPERCWVTRAPQPIVDPTPHTQSGRLLFVGNDFHRKGGDVLVAAMRHLPECTLTIVSNDRAALAHDGLPRIMVVSGIQDPAELTKLYRHSDLLVLPTRYDAYSLVICEAAAHGVPALATRVGSIGELLDESGGISLPEDATPSTLARTIRAVLGDGFLEHSYVQRAHQAADFARSQLTLDRFERSIVEALEAI